MIPFLDLRAQYQNIKNEIDSAIKRVFESTQFILGNEVSEFEKEFAQYCDTKYGIAVNSGTSALHLALLASNIGTGDEVITVPLTFVATIAAICYTGAKPIFIDVDPQSYTIDPNKIIEKITNRTKAILPVHLYGQPADMDSILNIAKQYNLIVIEDAAQAHGAEYKGRRVGSLGELGCFSFYPGKNLGAYGEGGIVVTNNPHFAKVIRMQRDWGQETKYKHILKGYNYRMDGIQGAILRVKLKYLETWTETRRNHANLYKKLLNNSNLVLPKEIEGRRHVYHIFGIQIKDRYTLQKVLNNHGIGTNIHYPYPVHLLPAYSDLGYKKGDFPISEEIANHELSLPMFPELSEKQIKTITEVIKEFIE